MSRSVGFSLALGLQVVILLTIAGAKMIPLIGGGAIMLHIQPVDPRDLLRGDYVTFRYDISSVSPTLFSDDVRNGQSVYVVLQPKGKYWTASRVISDPPTAGQTFLKATVDMPELDSDILYHRIWKDDIRLTYGMEQYFIPEGAGQTFSFWQHDVAAEIKVGENGNATLKQLYVDGIKWP